MIDESTEEQASLYVLGLLVPDEARRFESAMAADAELADLVARIETGAAALAATVPPRDPPPALRGRIMNQIRGEEPAKLTPFRGWLPWAVAVCLALTAGRLGYESYRLHLLVDDFRIRDEAQQRELDTVQGRETLLQRHLSDALGRIDSARKEIADLKTRDALSQIKIATLASMLKDAPQAMAVVAWDSGAQRGFLKAANIPAARPDQDYQLWIIDPEYKTPVSAGVFDPAQGSRFQPAHPIAKADKFAISLEKKGGSSAPQGPIVLAGD